MQFWVLFVSQNRAFLGLLRSLLGSFFTLPSGSIQNSQSGLCLLCCLAMLHVELSGFFVGLEGATFLIALMAVLMCIRKALCISQCQLGRCISASSLMVVLRLWSLLRAEIILGLAGNVGDMSATCRRCVKMSSIFAQNACWCQHQNSPNTEFCVGFLTTLYHIPRSYICTNTHTKNLRRYKDPLPFPPKMTQLLFIHFCNSTMAHLR